jgi:hypothetical protein
MAECARPREQQRESAHDPWEMQRRSGSPGLLRPRTLRLTRIFHQAKG